MLSERVCEIEKLYNPYLYNIKWGDKLSKFVSEGGYAVLKQDHAKEVYRTLFSNLRKLRAAALKLGVKEIYIGKYELCTAGDEKVDAWPAIWRVYESLIENNMKHKYEGGCGNSQQHQTGNAEKFFPSQYIDKAINLETMEFIDVKPFERYMVVSRSRGFI